ncbi:MAG: hypothetical protein AAF909_10965 [Pseudomonadota bacterium]
MSDVPRVDAAIDREEAALAAEEDWLRDRTALDALHVRRAAHTQRLEAVENRDIDAATAEIDARLAPLEAALAALERRVVYRVERGRRWTRPAYAGDPTRTARWRALKNQAAALGATRDLLLARRGAAYDTRRLEDRRAAQLAEDQLRLTGRIAGRTPEEREVAGGCRSTPGPGKRWRKSGPKTGPCGRASASGSTPAAPGASGIIKPICWPAAPWRCAKTPRSPRSPAPTPR